MTCVHLCAWLLLSQVVNRTCVSSQDISPCRFWSLPAKRWPERALVGWKGPWRQHLTHRVPVRSKDGLRLMCILFCTPKRHPQRYVGPSGHSRFKLILQKTARFPRRLQPFSLQHNQKARAALPRPWPWITLCSRCSWKQLAEKTRSREEADLPGTARVVGAYMGGKPIPEPTLAKFESWRWNIVALKERHRWSLVNKFAFWLDSLFG